ncbi:MAG TPA: methyltetrahydrofolate cobalamin methyltransferase [bacterium]|nr:methyltetrahydrofolate cobalamin methyltransferase [bacterium]
MLIIGERINATRKGIKAALLKRDEGFIREEASAQAGAGADYIDVNGGTSPAEELENMVWLCEVVQGSVPLPLCLDSASPEVIEAGLKRHQNGKAIVNSISMEKSKYERMLPLVKEYGAGVVALAMDDSGIPRTAADRLRVVARVVAAASGHGIALSDVYIDPLVMALSADNGSGLLVIEVLRGIKEQWPELKTTCGLSNISFGLPNRRLVNRVFLAMLMAHGLDSAIIDPLDAKLAAAAITGRALLGRDEYCMEYLKAYRGKRLEV